MLPSPARFGVSSSPSLPPNPNPNANNPKLPPSSSKPQTGGGAAVAAGGVDGAPVFPSSLLPLLPPLPRAQSILLQMSSLASKLFDVSPNRALWLTSFRGSLPSFSPSSVPSSQISSTAVSAPSTSKEILPLSAALQSQLFEAVAELQEILDLQDSRLKLAREIRPLDSQIQFFTKKIKEAEQVLDRLLDEYRDYYLRPSKRSRGDDPWSNEPPPSNSLHSELDINDVLAYAHRVSYTTYAPPEHGRGLPLPRWSLPPAPQEDRMRASMLYHFADLDVGIPKKAKAVEPKERSAAAGGRADAPDAVPLMAPTPPRDDAIPAGAQIPMPMLPINVPPGWKKGMPVELPIDLPPVPPGWKPGDPVTLPPLDEFTAGGRREEQRTTAQPPKAPEAIQVKYVQLDINPDQDDYSSDYSSDAGISDDDDED